MLIFPLLLSLPSKCLILTHRMNFLIIHSMALLTMLQWLVTTLHGHDARVHITLFSLRFQSRCSEMKVFSPKNFLASYWEEDHVPELGNPTGPDVGICPVQLHRGLPLVLCSALTVLEFSIFREQRRDLMFLFCTTSHILCNTTWDPSCVCVRVFVF